jgi:ATP-dependent Clp protease protease subunit
LLLLLCRLNGLYASHTGKPIKVIEQAMDRDLFMDPNEAQEFGIIDSIINNRKPTQASGEQ